MEQSNDIIHLSFRYAEGEYIAVARTYLRRVRRFTLRSLTGPLVILLGMGSSILFGDSNISFAFVFLGVILSALYAVAYFQNPKALYRKHPFLKQPYEVDVTDEGLSFR